MITYPTNKLQKVLLSGGCEQRNLPSGYTQVAYLEASGTQYINTQYEPNANTEVKINFSTTTLPSTDAYIFHSSDGVSARVSLAITQHMALFGDDIEDTRNRVTLPEFTANTAYDITVNKDKTIVNGTEYNFAHTSVTLPTMGNIGVFASRRGTLQCQGRIKSFRCLENNVLKINLIPCKRNSDNVLGMYDTVTGNFLTNAGTGSFTAGADVVPTPTTPMDIVCNNGVLKVNRNLYSTEYHNKILSQSDGVTVSSISGGGVNISAMVDCRTIKSFKITTASPQGSFRIFKYGADNTFIDATSTANIGDIVTFGDNVGFFRIQYNYTSTSVGIENILIYDSAHNLGIYTDGTQEVVTDNLGNTADAERLLGIGDYKDTQSVLDGKITRNIGIKVLDGTENWEIQNGAYPYFFVDYKTKFSLSTNSYGGFCSHFQCVNTTVLQNNQGISLYNNSSTDNTWVALRYNNLYSVTYENIPLLKQWLADQYAAGTPVIIVYPLATPTTEQVTPQPLAGSSATVIAGSIDNLPIESSTIAELKKRYIGDNEVKKVYIGDNLVYEQ